MRLHSVFSLIFLVFWAFESQARDYVSASVALLEPREGLVKSVYKKQSSALGVAYGMGLPDPRGALEFGFSWRQYESQVIGFESETSLYELSSLYRYQLPGIPNVVDFSLAFGLKFISFETLLELEETEETSRNKRDYSLGYQYEFGAAVPLPSLTSTLRFSVGEDHIYKAVFGDFKLDGHIYRVAWEYEL